MTAVEKALEQLDIAQRALREITFSPKDAVHERDLREALSRVYANLEIHVQATTPFKRTGSR